MLQNFIDLFDKIEAHLLSCKCKNLIKYFFRGKDNITYSFNVCNHIIE